MPRDGASGGAPGRDETAQERADRRWNELLQEVRVAQTGVQILLGFLLTVAFTPRFPELSTTDRGLYVTTVLLGAAATGMLIGPVALHRVLTGRQLKPQTVTWASALTLTGLVLLLCTVVSAMLLVLRVALPDTAAGWMAGGLGALFVTTWFVLPPLAWLRHRDGSRGRGRDRDRDRDRHRDRDRDRGEGSPRGRDRG